MNLKVGQSVDYLISQHNLDTVMIHLLVPQLLTLVNENAFIKL